MTILEALNKYYVKFGFDKVTTETYRPALGSRNLNILPKTAQPTGGRTAPNIPGLIRYYDIEKHGWRSFYINQVKFWYAVDQFGQPL